MIQLNVIGVPYPQGSKSAFIRGGRAIVTEGGSKTGQAGHKAWRQAVATAARDYVQVHQQPALSGAVAVVMNFRFTPVKSDRFRTRHTTKPDLDKLARAVNDALADGGILAGDSIIWALTATKTYADDRPPGCQIAIKDDAALEGLDRTVKKEQARLDRKKPSTERETPK